MSKTIFNQTLGFPQLSTARIPETVQELSYPESLLTRNGKLQHLSSSLQNHPSLLSKERFEKTQSTLGLLQKSKSPLIINSNRFKKYLPNIIEPKNYDKDEGTATAIKQWNISRKLQSLDVSNTKRQDVSFLNETSTPTHTGPTILTTGDKGQDQLLEATMGLKNIGRSLINLPKSIEELKAIMKIYEETDTKPDGATKVKEEEILDQYIAAVVSPIEALQLLQKEGKLDVEGMKKTQLQTLRLKQFFHKQKEISPNARQITQEQKNMKHKSPQKSFQEGFVVPCKSGKEIILFNVQQKPQSLNQSQSLATIPLVKPLSNGLDNRPESILTFSDNLMKDYGKQAFLNDSKCLRAKSNRAIIDQVMEKLTKNEQKQGYSFKEQDSTLLQQAKVDKTAKLDHIPQNLGNPSSRQDAIILIDWFEEMMKLLSESKDHPESAQTLSLLQLVLNLCIHELTRQVSVQCVERGLLLKRVFESYIRFAEILHSDHLLQSIRTKQDYAEKLDHLMSVTEFQNQLSQNQISELEAKTRFQAAEIEELYKSIKDQNQLLTRLKRKCANQQRDLDSTTHRLRISEKEAAHMRHKLEELKEDFGIEGAGELDERDRMRILFEVEREMQELEAEKQSREKFGTSKTSKLGGNGLAGTLSNMSESDFNATLRNEADLLELSDQQTSTEDFIKYIQENANLRQYRDKEIQFDAPMPLLVNRETNITSYQLQLMDSVSTDTCDLLGNSPKKQGRLTIIEEDDEDDSNQEEASSNSESSNSDLEGGETSNSVKGELEQLDKLNLNEYLNLISSTQSEQQKQVTQSLSPNKGRLSMVVSQSHQLSPALGSGSDFNKPQLTQSPSFQTTKLIEQLAITLVKRANYILSNEVDRIEKVAQNCPPKIALELKQSLKQTQSDVERITKEMSKKQRKVRKALKKNRIVEVNLKDTNERVENLEMENYNLRERFQEQEKLLDECRALVQELLTLVELVDEPSSSDQAIGKPEETQTRIREIVVLLNEMLHNQVLQLPINEDAEPLPTGTGTFINATTSNEQENINLTDQHQSRVTSISNPSPYKTQNTEKTAERGRRKRDQVKQASLGKSKETHPAYIMMKKIVAKDPKKLKDIMPRKMLLRIIYQVYQERGLFDLSSSNNDLTPASQQAHQVLAVPQSSLLQQVQSVSSQQQKQGDFRLATANSFNQSQSGFQTTQQQQQSHQSVIEWIYDSFMQKYGLKNVADRKFNQLIASCIIYKDQLPRISLFGRFLEIYDDLPTIDYNRYLKLIQTFSQQILNFKIDENSDLTLLPLSRALDYFKFKFESKHVPHVLTHRIHQIERKKVPVSHEDVRNLKHLKGVRDAVDFDWFSQFVIDNYIFLEDDKENCLRDLFAALDVSGTGFIAFKQFSMAMKIFYNKSSKQVERIFDIRSRLADSTNLESPKVLSQESFINLCLDKEYFTPRVQHVVIKSKHPEKDFLKLQEKLGLVISLFRARLVSIEMNTNEQGLELLENLNLSVKYPQSPRIAWLCFRMTDEFIKRMYLKKTSDGLTAMNLSLITHLRVKPSPQLLSSLSNTYFDTNQ